MEKARRIEGFAGFVAAGYRRAAEIGIGHFPDVAYALIEAGCDVFATDILPFEYDKVKVILDDVTRPDLSLYAGVDLIYSMHPPPELVPYMGRLAGKVSADLIIKPLSSEYPEGMELMRTGNTTFFLRRRREITNRIIHGELCANGRCVRLSFPLVGNPSEPLFGPPQAEGVRGDFKDHRFIQEIPLYPPFPKGEIRRKILAEPE